MTRWHRPHAWRVGRCSRCGGLATSPLAAQPCPLGPSMSPEEHRETQRRYYARKRAKAVAPTSAERAAAEAAGLCWDVYRHRRARGATHAEAMAGPRSPGRKVHAR